LFVHLDVFKFDPEYEENEEKYQAVKREILGEDGDEAEGSDDDSGSDGSEDEDEDEEEETKGIKLLFIPFSNGLYS